MVPHNLQMIGESPTQSDGYVLDDFHNKEAQAQSKLPNRHLPKGHREEE
jgi:hypothetical protein